MKNTFGNNVSVTIFGESHGNAIGVVIDGLAPGVDVDENYINKLLELRRPAEAISTSRKEADKFVIESGVFEGKTTGTPICILIPNEDTRSKDYSQTRWLARPSHADYTSNCKYHGYEDFRGGGHFSGRITAGLVAAGGIILPALNKKGIMIGTHIKKCAGISDRDFSDNLIGDIESLYEKKFAVLDAAVEEQMKQAIISAKNNGNSVGGILETAITGIDAGVGEPWFDTVEGVLSHAVFSVPGIKGIEFGAGFGLADMYGSESNDSFCYEGEKVVTKTNNSGGINGGITNGMPIVFRCAVRPTPTLSLEQNTVDLQKKQNAVLNSKGRHDPCIVHRARIVVDCITAITVCDMMTGRYGTDWLAEI
ncbi:MAG: chorismate synthase [Ruminococcaceae bacterium]|nr:chorismate synthase [Oscillospiraceae bacterium]